MKISDYVIKFISNLGVDRVFCVTGGGAMHLNNSLGSSEDVKGVFMLHEQGASIADLYGQLKTIEDSMNLRRANLKTEMQTETNVKNAALLFSVYYEGCSKCKDESYCGTQYRIARANSIYNYYVNNNYSITGITNEIVRSGDSSVDTNKCIP